MKRPEKEVVVAELTEAFRNADAVYLTEYRGLTVPQISDLGSLFLNLRWLGEPNFVGSRVTLNQRSVVYKSLNLPCTADVWHPGRVARVSPEVNTPISPAWVIPHALQSKKLCEFRAY